MATAIFLMLSGNSMEFTSHTVIGDTYQECLGKVLTELGSPCMWDVYDHEVVQGTFLQEGWGYEGPVIFSTPNDFSDFDSDIPF